MKDKPEKTSIVIAAWNGIPYLRDCLLSLANQVYETSEIIVVSNFDDGILETKNQFPQAKFFILERKTSVPKLFTFGIEKAENPIIALTEDFGVCDENWVSEIEKTHRLPFGIIGGAVENTSIDNLINWAVYFFDYSKYIAPENDRIIDTLSEINISYKKEILIQFSKFYEHGFFANCINDKLKENGYELHLTPTMIVYHHKNYNFQTTINQYFHQARSFAFRRVLNISLTKRLLFIFGSSLLPIILTGRISLRIIKKKRHLKKFIKCLPFLLILVTVWAFGEFCGYLFGLGNSDKNWS